jgi:hypothetical protein
LLQLADSGGASCAQARALTATRIADLDRRIAELHRMRRCLADLGAVCRGPGPGQLCRVMVQTVDSIDGTDVDRDRELCGCPSG